MVSTMRRVHILVHGQVTGVGFRSFVVRKARELGLVGYVLNISTNGVEIVAEGEPAKVEQLLAYCRKGPATAMVTEVIVEEGKAKGEFTSFMVK